MSDSLVTVLVVPTDASVPLGDGEAGAPRLDRGTLSGSTSDRVASLPDPYGAWRVNVYPGAGEAVFYLPREDSRPEWAIEAAGWDTSGENYQEVLPHVVDRTVSVEEAWDLAHQENEAVDDKALDNRLRAARRARTRVRRYCKSNGLSRLWTLSFREDVRDRDDVIAALNAFFRSLRAGVGSKLPYLWVIEEHESGALHVHVVLDRVMAKRCDRCDPAGTGKGLHRRDVGGPCLGCTWGHGFVDGRRIKGQKARGERSAATTAASYVAKYVGKGIEESQPGQKSYEVARGFMPDVIALELPEIVRSHAALGEIAGAYFDGLAPSFVWSSDTAEDWMGPPVRVAFWD